ncbi:uncharacterized protein TNCV_4680191 [Trichonephila clavipes]|nr:uncharacterized protein TNCV_4680191 [Trichonephila clavipes]
MAHYVNHIDNEHHPLYMKGSLWTRPRPLVTDQGSRLRFDYCVFREFSGDMFIKCLATLTAVPLGLGSNPGEDMDICKCIVPVRHGGNLNSRRVASPLVRKVEGEEIWDASYHPKVFSL